MRISEIIKLDFIGARNEIKKNANIDSKIKDSDLKVLLTSNQNDLIICFLECYSCYNLTQLQTIETFIDANLENGDRFFVSELIDFGSEWGLNLNYDRLLKLAKSSSEEDHFVVLSVIKYISENVKTYYIERIFSTFNYILNTSSYFQNVQLAAAIGLFRISQDDHYLKIIDNWFDNNEVNKVFLKNYLDHISFSKLYFKPSKEFREFLSDKI